MRPKGAERGCAHCPLTREGSSWDGVHLFCEGEKKWTNLLHPDFVGDCLFGLTESINRRNAMLAATKKETEKK